MFFCCPEKAIGRLSQAGNCGFFLLALELLQDIGLRDSMTKTGLKRHWYSQYYYESNQWFIVSDQSYF
jgi:hypothetical protein